MGALTADRNTPQRQGDEFSAPVAAATKIYAGSIVCSNSAGYAVPASVATTLIPLGRANQPIDNSAGGNGDKLIRLSRGVFRFANSAAGDAITRTEIGKVVYLVDDQTVAKTSGSNTRSRAGFVVDVDADGVWLLLGYGLLSDPAGAALVANNLSDLANAATARANLGVNHHYVGIDVTTLVGTGVYYAVAPLAGTITKIRSVIEGVLSTGDATLTGKINGTGITNGVLTITQAGSAAGDADVATPSALNTVVAGDAISLTVGGSNATATRARAIVEITY